MNKMNRRPLDGEQPAKLTERGRRVAVTTAAGFVALLAFGIANSMDTDSPEPKPLNNKEYLDAAAKSSKDDQNPDDKVLIPYIEQNSEHTAFSSVFENPAVATYILENPSEKAAIQASATNVPHSPDGYALVGRDIDGDGDKDAIVVQKLNEEE